MLQGTLDVFSLDEVLGLLAGAAKTGILNIDGDRGVGNLGLVDGQVTSGAADLETGDGSLASVVFELLRFEAGSFVFDADGGPGEGGAEPVAAVLAAAHELLDEWRQIEAVVPSLHHGIHLVDSLPASETTIADHEWETVVAVGEGTTVGVVADRLGLGEVDGSRRIKLVVERGFVALEEPGSAPTISIATESAAAETAPTAPVLDDAGIDDAAIDDSAFDDTAFDDTASFDAEPVPAPIVEETVDPIPPMPAPPTADDIAPTAAPEPAPLAGPAGGIADHEIAEWESVHGETEIEPPTPIDLPLPQHHAVAEGFADHGFDRRADDRTDEVGDATAGVVDPSIFEGTGSGLDAAPADVAGDDEAPSSVPPMPAPPSFARPAFDAAQFESGAAESGAGEADPVTAEASSIDAPSDADAQAEGDEGGSSGSLLMRYLKSNS